MADRVLTPTQRSRLQGVRHRRGGAPADGEVLSEEAILRSELDAWIADVSRRSGRLSAEALKHLKQLKRASRGGAVSVYAEEADAVVNEAKPGGGAARGTRFVSGWETLVIGIAQFVTILALNRYAFHHSWGDSAGMAGAFAVTWMVGQAALARLSAWRRRRRDAEPST